MAIREFKISGVLGVLAAIFVIQLLGPPPPPPASTLSSGGTDRPPLNVYIVSRFILTAVKLTSSTKKYLVAIFFRFVLFISLFCFVLF